MLEVSQTGPLRASIVSNLQPQEALDYCVGPQERNKNKAQCHNVDETMCNYFGPTGFGHQRFPTKNV